MKKSISSRLLLLLSMLIGAFTMSRAENRLFTDPDTIKVNETIDIAFQLENSSEFYGFQADISFPEGLAVVETDNHKAQWVLSERAEDYSMVSNVISENTLRIGAFSNNHQAITGNSGNLFYITVRVTENFEGGTLTVSNVLATKSDNTDIPISGCMVAISKFIPVSSVILSPWSVELKVGEKSSVTARVRPEDATEQDIAWRTSDDTIVTVDDNGNIEAVSLGNAYVFASCGEVESSCYVSVIPTPAESVKLNKESLKIKVGDYEMLYAEVLPDDTTDKTVVWSTSDSSIAGVNDHGDVMGRSEGDALITATCGDVSASCSVKVIPATVIRVNISNEKLTLNEGEAATLTVTIEPEYAADKSVTWTSSDSSIASVSDEGVVTAIKEGTATITATSSNGIKATCTVTVLAVNIPVSDITIDKSEISLTEGETAALTATITPEDATDMTVTWTSSDSSIASVDANGNVTAVAPGTATITASSSNGKTATCTVNISARFIDVTEITISMITAELKVGESVTLTASVHPENATDKTVTWSSSDESIATVDANGNVTAVKAGTAIVTARCGGVEASCIVNVEAKYVFAESLTISPVEWSGEEGSSFTISATVLPENTTDKSLSWESSDISIATVDDKGVVTVLKEGSCIVTVTTLDGSDLKAECLIVGLSGVDEIFATPDSKADVYDMNGVLLKRDCSLEDLKQLQPAIYILRQSNGRSAVFIHR